MNDQVLIQYFYWMADPLSKTVEAALQELLNAKHLYQSHKVAFPEYEPIFKEYIAPRLAGTTPLSRNDARYDFVKTFYEECKKKRWAIHSAFYGPTLRTVAARSIDETSIEVNPPTIRSFCKSCQNIEPYNFIDGNDVLAPLGINDQSIQVFSLAYQCQGCKGTPEVFLIRREGIKIILSGRSPMEQVIVESQIPKSHKSFISDAIVAYNSGQVLAGIFFLRTFIEQYVRSKSKTPLSQDMDTLFEEYATPIPPDFKSRFPSLSNIYDELSNAIHGATPSEEVFIRSKERIEEHFDAKRLYRIPN